MHPKIRHCEWLFRQKKSLSSRRDTFSKEALGFHTWYLTTKGNFMRSTRDKVGRLKIQHISPTGYQHMHARRKSEQEHCQTVIVNDDQCLGKMVMYDTRRCTILVIRGTRKRCHKCTLCLSLIGLTIATRFWITSVLINNSFTETLCRFQTL